MTYEELYDQATKENLGFDLVMSIMYGYNPYGYIAYHIDPEYIDLNGTTYTIDIPTDLKEKNQIKINIKTNKDIEQLIKDHAKYLAYWLEIHEGKCNLLVVGCNESNEVLVKRSLRRISIDFFEKFKINNMDKLLEILKEGYKLYKKEMSTDNSYSLHKDNIDQTLDKAFRFNFKN